MMPEPVRVVTDSIRWVRSYILVPLALVAIIYACIALGAFLMERTHTERLQMAALASCPLFNQEYREASQAAQDFLVLKRNPVAYGEAIKGLRSQPADGSAGPIWGQEALFAREASPLIAHYRKAHLYFEKLGVLVKHRELNFDLVYDLVSFPDAFWKESEELRRTLSKHWNLQREELRDFGDGIAYLQYRYEKARALNDARPPEPWQQKKEAKP